MTADDCNLAEYQGSSFDGDAARRVVDAAVQRYFEARRAKVDAFVDAHFTLAGSLGLHRKAVGLDLVRAPANVALMVPLVGLRLSALAARRLGAREAAEWLSERNLLLRTAVDLEIEWLIHGELLELPFDDGDRKLSRDALAEEILSDPDLIEAMKDPLL
ncbi:MAG: hypothetical protein P8N43_08590, partial [Alphaproteobacteria bacterium]|nr:hypothetical protein [Alphaproteobacteria bacterium]